jgi:uncharacterized protein
LNDGNSLALDETAGSAGRFGFFWRAIRFLLAPFTFNGWSNCFSELKALDSKKAQVAAMKAAIYYALFSPLIAMPFYNTVLFHPYVTGYYDFDSIAGVKKQDILFRSGSERLHGWYFSNPASLHVVLISHGNAGNITHRKSLIKLLLETGASVFIYDYEGYGLSTGSPSIDKCCLDATAAFDCLSSIKDTKQEIVLYGESIGTGITCELARLRCAKKIILQSGFQSLPQIAREKVPLTAIYPEFVFPCKHLDTRKFLEGNHPPVLLIHGRKDEIIPAHNSRDLYAASSGTRYLVELPDAGHNDIVEKMDFQALSAISAFLGKDAASKS